VRNYRYNLTKLVLCNRIKILIFIISLLQNTLILFAQKKLLDSTAYEGWPHVITPKISNDGKFLIYTIRTQKAGPTLIIQATDNSWKKEVPRVNDATLTANNKYAIYSSGKDSVLIQELGGNKLESILNSVSFKIPNLGSGEWIAYQLNTSRKELVLRNLLTGLKTSFSFVDDYYFNNSGNVLVIQTEASKDSNTLPLLLWYNLSDGKMDTIQYRTKASNLIFDESGTRLAFVTEEKNNSGQLVHALKYFRLGMDSAETVVDDQSEGMKGYIVSDDEQPKFSRNGQKLYFDIREISYQSNITPDPKATNVDIWSYRDNFLQSQQLWNLDFERNKNSKAVITENDNKIIRLQNNDDWEIKLADDGNGNYALTQTKVNSFESDWRLEARPNIYLISTKDGARKLIKERLLGNASFSPKGKYVIWFDREQRQYFCYNVSSGVTKIITHDIPVPLYDEKDDHPRKPFPLGIAGWLEDDKAALIYDHYDIWQVDPEGVRVPINITKSYGKKNKTVLRFMNINVGANDAPIIKSDTSVVLVAFDEINKYNGFFKQKLGNNVNPVRLIMGPYLFYYPQQSSFTSYSPLPIKAKNEEIYIIQRMNAIEYPNLFITRDFKDFVQITNLAPQKGYNWLTAELVRWRMSDGNQTEGILYKPESFDRQKKYPIIYYLYEKFTDGLNYFLDPNFSTGPICIPEFVSNGYLIFCPNVYYEKGKVGESAYKYVVSAVSHFSKFSWIDMNKMGLQGHSFGGYEVNYIITRTHLFAAAMSAAGPSDFISQYGSVRGQGHSFQYLLEFDQNRMGATLWQKPDLYITNSPIFFANKITTPLLMMHNKNDGAVPWQQGIEYFTALRRLGKKVWMLQYDEEGHTLRQTKNQQDFSIRMMQFFNHFLKGASSPKWMTDGIPAQMKGLETGY
jgi:dienelactone hydrolase